MKKILIIIILSSLFFSCEDYLELNPKSEYTASNMWNNEKEATGVMMSAYDEMRNVFKKGYAWYGDFRSGYFSRENNSVEAQKLCDNTLDATISSSDWNGLYRIISLCNYTLYYTPLVPDPAFNKTNRNRLRGEAFFVRALTYFYIARIWEEAPLITIPYNTTDLNFEVEPTKNVDMFGQIKADIDSAVFYLPAERVSDNSTQNRRINRGRASTYSCWALKADVHMWLKEYQAAIDAVKLFEGVSRYYNSAQKSWKLERDWHYMFLRRDNVNAAYRYPDEMIFEIQFNNQELAYSNQWSLWSNSWPDVYYKPNFEKLMDLNRDTIRGQADIMQGGRYGKYRIDYKNADPEDANIIMYRLSDLLLLSAEAHNRLGDKKTAIDIVTLIRERVNVAPDVYPISESMSMEDIEEEIRKERVRELLAEGKVWFDMVRQGKTSMAGVNSLMNIYWPIHSDNLKTNPKLKQNSYYVTD